jgi:para-nitrobenzyl esterase
MTMALALTLSLMLSVASLSPSSAIAAPIIVQTPQGQLEGLQTAKTTEFRGIRYATAQRFEAPVPTNKWDNVKQAMQFGSNCPQAVRFNLTEESLDEDCLFLNVTVPNDTSAPIKLPVMVWIPGGGFVGGGSNLYDASRLATEGKMVVVTLNYRVGVFGFMPHPAMDAGSNGTLGLEDQRLALKWVKDNIAAFGGDPDNVTIAGESAGSGSICLHLASPERLARLFRQAVLISGACLQQLPTLEQALKSPIWQTISHNPKDPSRRFKCPIPGDADYSDAVSLECLKKIPVSDLLEAQTFEAGNNLIALLPVTGNQTVPRTFKEAVQSGEIMKVPMVIGGATDELRLYVAYDTLGDNPTKTPYPVNQQNLRNHYLPAYYGTDLQIHRLILQRYFGSDSDPVDLNGASLGSMLSDFNPHVGINHCLYLRTSNKLNGVAQMPPLYQFEFNDPNALVLGVGLADGKDPGFALGAVHSSILNYLFPNFSNTKAIDAPDLPKPSDALASHIIQYLANFMRDGAPSAPSAPSWPRYDGTLAAPASDKVMLFKPNDIRTYAGYGDLQPESRAGHQCAFWQTLFSE